MARIRQVHTSDRKLIRSLLTECAVIIVYQDQPERPRRPVLVEDVMIAGQEHDFDQVTLMVNDDGSWDTMEAGIHDAYFFMAYRTVQVAQRLMTDPVWRECFPAGEPATIH